VTPRRVPKRIEVRHDAWEDLVATAQSAFPTETGGILLGYRIERGVHVAAGLEVPDPNAGPTDYLFRQEAAQQRLDEALRELQPSSPVGYVGDWHSHPGPIGPSPIDRRSLRGSSRHYQAGIAALVLVWTNNQWAAHGLAAQRRRLRTAPVDVINNGVLRG